MSEIATVLGVPSDDFVRLWSETLDVREVGQFAHIEANIEHIFRTLGLDHFDGDMMPPVSQMRLEFMRRSLSPRPDAVSTLARLRGTDHKIGLISDCAWETAALWPETPFAPLVDVPIFSCVERLIKPDPRIYLLSCERLTVKPQDCLYVGDGSSHELTGAAQVGMHPVLLRVPGEDSYNAYRREAQTWQGSAILALKDVFTLV